jgi:hypothetical protein
MYLTAFDEAAGTAEVRRPDVVLGFRLFPAFSLLALYLAISLGSSHCFEAPSSRASRTLVPQQERYSFQQSAGQ